MEDRTRLAIGIGLGALAGGFVSYLLFTERGRQMRDQLEPGLEQLVSEVQRLGAAFERTRRAVSEGLGQLSHVASESDVPRDWKQSR
jgi:hypothetical protein